MMYNDRGGFMTITITLSDELMKKLAEKAQQHNLTVEQLMVASAKTLAEDSSAREKRQVSDAIEYVIRKNDELLRRLA
jgi:hypothetical protein